MSVPRLFLIAALSLLFLGGMSAVRADTYVVTNANSSGPGSLGQAILDSNAHAVQDTIVFNIPGSGVHLINLSSAPLPEITDSLIVDGYSQPGAHPNTLAVGDDAVILIQLDGGSIQTAGNGLTISSSNCLIRGLSITRFTGNSNPDPFSAPTTGFGILLKGPGTGNVVQGNFLGVEPDGVTPGRNLNGVRAREVPQTIGGSDVAARNVISGNSIGVGLYGGTGSGTVVSGNYIGTDSSGTRAVPNEQGIVVGVTDAVIGGSEPLAGNLISGNIVGVSLGGSVAYHITASGDHALVQGNSFGTTADGTGALGNTRTAISFVRSSGSTIGGLEAGAGNTIAHNDDGIIVRGTANSILSNTIYGNNGRGIIFDGPVNEAWSAPVITAEGVTNGIATVSGTLQSAANTQFRVQLFADSQSLISSRQTFIGSITVVTDDNGKGSFTVSFPFDDDNVVFNATATAPTSPNGSTSEFARNPAYLQNLSARAVVGTGGDALIGGLIVGSYNEVAVRGIGPSLKAFGIEDALADPTLEFRDSQGAQMFDDNWQDDQKEAALLQQKGVAPSDPLESGLMPFSGPPSPFLPSANLTQYTAILRGKGDTTGIGVVEFYGLAASFNPDFFSRMMNLSARGFVGEGENVIVGGFIIGGRNESTRVVVRAIGPSLENSGVTNPLPDPVLELHDNNGSIIQSNDNWQQSQAADLQAVGLAPANAAESAILIRLMPGAYTAVVRGKGKATGVALVEIYRLP